MKHVYINAGHWEKDTGAIHGPYVERDLVNKLRDLVVIELEKYKNLELSVHVVPDTLTLRESIAWINNSINYNRVEDESFAIDIHFNSNNNHDIAGTEAYYYEEKEAASIMSAQLASSLELRNRGAKPDSMSYVGSLGFVRNLNCPSVIIETAYITSRIDMLMYNEVLAAQGIVNGVAEVLDLSLSQDEQIAELKVKISILVKIVETYRQIISLLSIKK